MTVSNSNGARRSWYEFVPAVGPYTNLVQELATQIEPNRAEFLAALEAIANEALAESDAPCDMYRLRLAFSLSLISDILGVGGTIAIRDSRVLISWPDWTGMGGRDRAGHALRAASDLRELRRSEIAAVQPMFAADSDGETVAIALSEGEFHLVRAEERHPCGLRYMDAFAAALRLWTMPYRGRQGRMRRFVITCSHEVFGPHPVVAGLIEMGDEAPFCTWRDRLLGLEAGSFLEWLRTSEHRTDFSAFVTKIADHLRRVRTCLLHVPLYRQVDLAVSSAERVLRHQSELESLASGRSQKSEEFEEHKRIAYAIRLARGERALMHIANKGVTPEKADSDLAAGIRAIHDIVLPRVHMEAAVCGPVPPFSGGLGGKLVTAFLGSPMIRELAASSRGTVLEQSFDMDELEKHLPTHGMLCITTKGLYAKHAPMYNRAELPGQSGALRLKFLQTTAGNTTTFLSQRSARLARKVLVSAADGSQDTRVSLAYGTGGAKRHRTIETAAVLCGLPGDIVNAGISRPVYGAKFVRNAEAVIWTDAPPDWLVDPDVTPSEYDEEAVRLWRDRWLVKAVGRLNDYAFIPSATRGMGEVEGE